MITRLIASLFQVFMGYLQLGFRVLILRAKPEEYPVPTPFGVKITRGLVAFVVAIGHLATTKPLHADDLFGAALAGIVGALFAWVLIWHVGRTSGVPKGSAIAALIMTHAIIESSFVAALPRTISHPIELGLLAAYALGFFRVMIQKTEASE